MYKYFSKIKLYPLLLSIPFFILPGIAKALPILTFVSDTISTSAPTVSANHAISFKVPVNVPVSGKIVITPEAGFFNIPAGLNFQDVDVLVDGVNKNLSAYPGGGDLQVSTVTGSNGQITFYSSVIILAGSRVEINIGSNAVFGGQGTRQITNPAIQGSYKVYISALGGADELLSSANAMIAVVKAVQMGTSIDTTAPFCGDNICNGAETCSVCAQDCGACAVTPIGGGGGVVVAVPGQTVHYQHSDGSSITVIFPDWYWNTPIAFNLNLVFQHSLSDIASNPEGQGLVNGHAYNIVGQNTFGIFLTYVNKPSGVTLRYTPEQTDLFAENSIQLFILKPGATIWTEVPNTVVNVNAKTISGTSSDLGIYALFGVLKPAKPEPFIPKTCARGDFNCDNRVDLSDLSLLMSNWGVPKNSATDLNKDGVVNNIDYDLLVHLWTGGDAPATLPGPATLRFLLPKEKIYEGDEFLVSVYIDVVNLGVNAGRINFLFPKNIVQSKVIKFNDSIFSYWPEEPESLNSSGKIFFAGALPAPGFVGQNGKIGDILFKAVQSGGGEFSFFSSSKVYLNSSPGKAVVINSENISLVVYPAPKNYIPKKWETIADTTLPENFSPIVLRSPDFFVNKYFVSFHTTDSGSGIAYYEVAEQILCKADEADADMKSLTWEKAISPRILKNQTGLVRIFVRAVDKEGNETVGKAQVALCELLNWWLVALLLFSFTILSWTIYWAVKRMRDLGFRIGHK